MRRLLDIGDVRDLHGVRLCTVGPSTASRLQRYGIRVDLTPAALGQQCEARPNLTERAFGVPLGTLQFDLKPPVALEPVLDGLELVIEVRMSEDQEAVLSYAAGCRGRS